MGLGDESKAVSTPGVRMTDEDDGKECDAESRACYRSWTVRASYLCQDRCELQFAVKRLVRFLKGSPRCLLVYCRRAEQQFVASSLTATGRASHCFVINYSKCGGDKLRLR